MCSLKPIRSRTFVKTWQLKQNNRKILRSTIFLTGFGFCRSHCSGGFPGYFHYIYIYIFIHYIRHFRPKLVHWNDSIYCTPIDRALQMRSNDGWGSFLRPTVPELWGFLWNKLCRFLDKYTNIRRFSTIFCHKIRIFCLQKVQQNTVLSKMATQHIFN